MPEKRPGVSRVSIFLSVLSLVLAAMSLAWSVAVRREGRALQQELHEARKGLNETRETRSETADVGSGKPVGGMTRSGEIEWEGLRDEIARLRAEVARLAAQPAGRPVAAGSEVPALSPFMRHGRIDAEGLPGPVVSAFRQQLGDGPIEGASVKQSGGVFYFSTEARLADGRHLELSVDQTGRLVRRSLEHAVEQLDEPLQRAVLETAGQGPDPGRITEVLEDGRTFFRVQQKTPEQAATWTFSPEGELLSSEIHHRKR